jgi:SAM-dependent methyltransferase
MTFAVSASAYDRLMGAYSSRLAPLLADLADVHAGSRIIDVGCGPGALTRELVSRVGSDAVTGVDPSETFVEAARERNPGVDVRLASAESLPFEDASFDAALAQLVVHFMRDPVAGIREMGRVTRGGGVVAACVWDYGERRGPVSPLWEAARKLDPDVQDESELAGTRQGHLVELFEAAGLRAVEESSLVASVQYQAFEEWWEPLTLGVGPAGAFLAGVDAEQRSELRARCRALLPDPPFTIDARAWAARGVRP